MSRKKLTYDQLKIRLKKKTDSLHYYKGRAETLKEQCKSLEVDVEAIALSNSHLRNRMLQLSDKFSSEKRFIINELRVLFIITLLIITAMVYYIINL